MKKVIAWLLVLALTAAASIGATLAYLVDTDEDVNVMTLGKVKIDQLEYERIDDETKDEDAKVQEFHDNKPLYPGVYEDGFDFGTEDNYVNWDQIGKDGYTSGIWNPDAINNEVDKMVFVKNKGNYDAYVRSVFAFEAGNYADVSEFEDMVHLNRNTTDWEWEWMQDTPVTIGGSTYFIAIATYNKVLEPGALTEISLGQIALDKTATNADVEAFGDTYQVLVKSQAIQADGFSDPDIALTEGFGLIDADNIPWENDNPTKGINLKTALHYYEGGSTKITKKVANVVFGLTSDYSEIADTYDGTLVDVDQDVPVYAYYVPSTTTFDLRASSTYDIYFLANDDIYLPVDCTAMFSNMSELVSVDTSNLNTSRASNMTDLFYNCPKLASIDPSNWDTRNFTNLYGIFGKCPSLTYLDVSGWNTSNLVSMHDTFVNSTGLVTIKGLENWDTSNVTNMTSVFNGCTSLVNVGDIGSWDTSKVTGMSYMFYNCESLTELDINQWDTSNVVDMSFMFKGCRSLTELDLSGWDTGNVTTFSSMFSSLKSNNPDMQLKTVKLENWDTSSCTRFAYMFYGCGQLEELDLSGWDATNVTSTYHMFADCENLKSVDFTGWNTPNLTDMDGMFNSCEALETVDLSDLDTGNVMDMSQLFEYCYSLKEVKGLEKWDTSKVWDFKSMFFCCKSLEVVDLSGFNTSYALQVWRMFRDCTALRTIYVGDGWDMSNVDHSSTDYYTQMFTGCSNLVGSNGSTLEKLGATDDTYACVDTVETPGYLTHINDKPANP